jgi:hypothetical protein
MAFPVALAFAARTRSRSAHARHGDWPRWASWRASNHDQPQCRHVVSSRSKVQHRGHVGPVTAKVGVEATDSGLVLAYRNTQARTRSADGLRAVGSVANRLNRFVDDFAKRPLLLDHSLDNKSVGFAQPLVLAESEEGALVVNDFRVEFATHDETSIVPRVGVHVVRIDAVRAVAPRGSPSTALRRLEAH